MPFAFAALLFVFVCLLIVFREPGFLRVPEKPSRNQPRNIAEHETRETGINSRQQKKLGAQKTRPRTRAAPFH
jgi:hypothetical protein